MIIWARNMHACLLQIAVAPRFIKPVSGVCGGLAKLVGNGFVVVSRGRQKRVAGPGLWVWNTVSVQECLERTLRPPAATTTVNDVIMTTTTQTTKKLKTTYESKIHPLTLPYASSAVLSVSSHAFLTLSTSQFFDFACSTSICWPFSDR